MSRAEATIRIYTVVEVMSGVSVGARSFCYLNQARNYLKRLRRRRNLNEDDIQLFEDTLPLQVKRRRAA